jgi:hypothetical protein
MGSRSTKRAGRGIRRLASCFGTIATIVQEAEAYMVMRKQEEENSETEEDDSDVEDEEQENKFTKRRK